MSLRFNYGLDERLPPGPLLVYGLQWLAIAVPSLVIIGQVVAREAFADPAEQINYLQKLALVTGAGMGVQVLWGHRLPLVMGPAAVLLVGVLAAGGTEPAAAYGAVAAGGGLLALVAATGLLRPLQRLFTPRVVAAVLLLIALTLMPAVQRLLLGSGEGAPETANLLFGGVLAGVLLLGHRLLTGIGRATLVVWGLLGGSLLYGLLLAPVAWPAAPAWSGFSGWNWPPAFDPGVLLSFLFCFLALAVNDVGSIQSVQELLRPEDREGRLRRGVGLTGLANLLAGLLGVLGPVNFSLSPGVVTASGCASRLALLPAAAGLLLLGFSPAALALLGAVPTPVVGAVLLYILTAQVAAGLAVACGAEEGFRVEHGLALGMALLLGTLVAFLPSAVVSALPDLFEPVLGNGFVVGTMAVLVLEHLVFRPAPRQP